MSSAAARTPSRRLRRDRLVLLAGIGLATSLCWGYLLAGPMPGSPAVGPGSPSGAAPASSGFVAAVASGAAGRGWLTFAFAAAMWAIMMGGMMLPAASPMILAYGDISRREGSGHLRRTGLFVLGYLAVWAAYSVLGAGAQWGLRAARMLVPAGGSARTAFSAAILLTAGIYQLSPLKHACLRRCRTPVGFLLTEWRSGASGAVRMGLLHGSECVLCCWAVMALMLLVGMRDLLWMGALTAFMLAEKAMPGGHRTARASAVLLLAGGVWFAWRALAPVLP